MSSERVSDLLFTMRRKGVKLWVDDGKLRYRSPNATLTPQELESLRALKEDIISFLQQLPSVQRDSGLVQRLPSERIPLTFAQQHLCDMLDLEKGPSMRSVAAAVTLGGRLDVGALRGVFERLIHRHESLRTRIVRVEGVLEQRIDASSPYDLEVIDLTTLPLHDRETEARHLAKESVHESVSLATGPLFRARLLKLDPASHVLVLSTEHMISDAASIGILWRDIFTLYGQSVGALPYALPDMTIQYPDFAVWQQKTHSSWIQKHGTYWKERLAGARRVRLFPDERPTRPASVQWATLPVRFGESLTHRLLETSRRERSSLVMSVFTVFAALIMRWCNRTDLVLPFGTVGRIHPEVENTVGYFATPLHLRMELLEEDTFVDLLRRVTQEYATAHEHHDSWRMAVHPYRPEFIFNPLFNWIPQGLNMSPGGPGHTVQTTAPLTVTQYKLDIEPRDEQWEGEPRIDLSDPLDGVSGEIGYRADLISLHAVERFARSLLLFAQTMAQAPSTQVKAVTCEGWAAVSKSECCRHPTKL